METITLIDQSVKKFKPIYIIGVISIVLIGVIIIYIKTRKDHE